MLLEIDRLILNIVVDVQKSLYFYYNNAVIYLLINILLKGYVIIFKIFSL